MANKKFLTIVGLFLLWVLAGGCGHFGHYPVNDPLDKLEPGYGYIPQNVRFAGQFGRTRPDPILFRGRDKGGRLFLRRPRGTQGDGSHPGWPEAEPGG